MLPGGAQPVDGYRGGRRDVGVKKVQATGKTAAQVESQAGLRTREYQAG